MKDNKISIIVPVYNAEKYLEECLDSLIEQTYKNIEIILIDDGSTDKSACICDEYAEKDKRVKILHQKNSGVSVARNKGLDKHTGDYVMFVDSDDWIEPNTCEILINKITAEKKDLLIYNYYLERKNFSEKNSDFMCDNDVNFLQKIQAKLLAPTINIENIKCNGISLACTKIISSKILKKSRFLFEGKKALFEDGLFYYLLFEENINVGIVNEHLYHYRIISTSATHAYNESILYITDTIIDTVESVRKNHKNDSLYEEAFAIRKLHNLLYILNLNINNKKGNLKFFERVKAIKKEAQRKPYKSIYNIIDNKNLNKKLRVYYFLFKHKLYLILLIVNSMETIIKSKRQ